VCDPQRGDGKILTLPLGPAAATAPPSTPAPWKRLVCTATHAELSSRKQSGDSVLEEPANPKAGGKNLHARVPRPIGSRDHARAVRLPRDGLPLPAPARAPRKGPLRPPGRDGERDVVARRRRSAALDVMFMADSVLSKARPLDDPRGALFCAQLGSGLTGTGSIKSPPNSYRRP